MARETLAVLCETPLLVIAMIGAACQIPSKVGPNSDFGSLAAMGIVALVAFAAMPALVNRPRPTGGLQGGYRDDQPPARV